MVSNLFLQACEELQIPHTRQYTNKTFEEHPYKFSLYGLARLLEGYGVHTQGVRFNDKEAALNDIDTPFVAQVSGDLVLVTAITPTEVSYNWRGEIIQTHYQEFVLIWSGIALLMETTDYAGEPNYSRHLHEERINALKLWVCAGCIIFVLGITSILRTPSSFSMWMIVALFTMNLAGCYLSYLLMTRQLRTTSNVADRICSLLKSNTCSNLLDTTASKAAFDISWSEIGAAYFGVNFLVILLYSNTIIVLCPYALGALSYSMWSIWYQRFRARVWCVLCLMVQGVFIVQAITYLTYFYLNPHLVDANKISSCGIMDFILITSSYIASILIVHQLASIISKAHQADQWHSNFRNFKLRKEIFDCLLEREERYEPSVNSQIRFGNPNAQYRLTILSNPYCNPCGAMHARMSGIQLTDCSVEMVFASFGEKYDRVCRLMIAAYMQLGAEHAWKLYEEWYSKGKTKQEAFFDGLGLNETSAEVREEYNNHKEWSKRTALTATPTILVNGFKMPQSYTMEDFVDFMKIETC